jgi:hypothetical protein
MTSSNDQPGPGRPYGRRAATLLAAAVPLAAAAWATASAVTSFAAAAPPAATHASAMLTNPDCLAAFSGHQAPKYPECLGD